MIESRRIAPKVFVQPACFMYRFILTHDKRGRTTASKPFRIPGILVELRLAVGLVGWPVRGLAGLATVLLETVSTG